MNNNGEKKYSIVTLYVVIGLPGSGKSTLIKNEFTKNIPGENIFDDYHKNSKESSPAIEKAYSYEKVITSLRMGKDCVISDIQFCQQSHLNMLIERFQNEIPYIRFEFHCFRNQPDKCIKNIIRRNRTNREEEISKVRTLSRQYDLPHESIQYDVFENTN